MDYKKIIKSRQLRLAILQMLSFVPDEAMLKLQYRMKMGRALDLKDPKRFTEKLQWYKLYYHDPEMIRCVDKYEVREYLQEQGLGHLLNTCYGVFDDPGDIDLDSLPQSFVLKDTLGGGGNSVILVRDKAAMDWDAVSKQLSGWVRENHRVRGGGREWPYYSGKKHRILIEDYIHADEDKGGLVDYKFFCFGGEIACVYGVADRKNGVNAGIGIFDRDFRKLPYEREGEPLLRELPKPENYEEMAGYARQLSRAFPHVRVDFYDQDGRILFGELTFYNASGYMKYRPDEFDYILGERFVLPEANP